MENRMYAQMLQAARQRLADRQPEEIAANAKVTFDGSGFCFESLGTSLRVSYPQWQITPELAPWHQLVILHYLHLADGTPLTGQAVTFAQQKDGMIRGGGFDRKAENTISRLDYHRVKACCTALGGRERPSKADYCAELPFLPMYPVTLNYWQADEEFPASGRLLTDSSAEHYLTIEDAVTVGELLLERLEGTYGNQ